MVATGDTAVIHYVGRLADGDEKGAVFDTTDVDVALREGVYHGHRDYKPLEFEVGGGEMLPGIEDAVRTMAVGEARTITVDPTEAFGDRDEGRVVEVSREELETQSGRDASQWRLVQSATGEVGWITAVTEETVTVDFNHDLAGERLTFELKLLDVREASVEESPAE
jgi:peptidylprolyl isomerase